MHETLCSEAVGPYLLLSFKWKGVEPPVGSKPFHRRGPVSNETRCSLKSQSSENKMNQVVGKWVYTAD